MRPIFIGLIAAIVAATLPITAMAADAKGAAAKGPPITGDQKAQGMKDAPKLIAAAKLPCVVAGARFIGEAPDAATKKNDRYYEVACKDALGYIIVDKQVKDQPPIWETCLEPQRTDKLTGKPNPGACWLPGNTDDASLMQSLVAKSGVSCDVKSVRGIGHSDTTGYFEIACAGGTGYILETTSPPDPGGAVKGINCLNFPTGGQISCTLTSSDDMLKVVDGYAAQAVKDCAVKDRRYVGQASDGKSYFEVACNDGKGYMLEVAGSQVGSIPCGAADAIGGGCTLTDSRAAKTEDNAIYSKLAKEAGFACDVSRYGVINVDVLPQHEVVELQCGNRPDGGVGIFPTAGQGASYVYDCAHSELVSARCSFTKPDAAYAHVTADLQKLGKTSCVASGVRAAAISKDPPLAYLEIACADGGRGWMVSYSQPDMTPKEAIPCATAKDIGGGCELPTNKK